MIEVSKMTEDQLSPQAVCVLSSWVPATVPLCVSAGCDDLGLVDNADRETLNTWLGFPVSPGSVVRYSCHPGHVMEGEDTVWCDGIIWNSSAPSCSLPISPPRTSCNFDDVDVDPWCGWTQRWDLSVFIFNLGTNVAVTWMTLTGS